jgi:tetratricopeptide (TPR) repeat protein
MDSEKKLIALKNFLENQLREWHAVIRSRPNDPKAYIQRGMVNFKLAKIDESIQDFDTAEKLDPRLTPYLWQRGLSFYYADRFEEGAKQFEVDLTVNARDVEETVWRYLCIARQQSATEARNSLLAVRNDPRQVMRRVWDLYAGNCTADDVIAAGKIDGRRGLFYSHLYVGLYCEAESDMAGAREYIAKAVEWDIDDYMWYLARVHLVVRAWV